MTIALCCGYTQQATSVNPSDNELLDGLRRGDPAAFKELYSRHFRRIHNYAIRKLGDPAEAEDVTQDVFEAVFCCIDRFEGRAELVVWIYGIARNVINNRLRRRGGVRLVSIDDIPADAGPVDLGPQPLAEAREVLRHVRDAIDALPIEQRRILEMRHEQCLPIREIGRRLGRSEDAIKSSLYRARRTLAASLPPEHTDLTF